MSRVWIAARKLQVAERQKVYEADQPPKGLVSEGSVEAKRAVLRTRRSEIERLEKRRAAVTTAIDRLVGVERELAGALGSLGYRLEEARAAVEAEKASADATDAEVAEPGSSGPPATAGDDDGDHDSTEEAETELQERLLGLQLKEGVLKLKMRLLYISVQRATLRGTLYDEAIRLLKEEERAVANVVNRYEAELLAIEIPFPQQDVHIRSDVRSAAAPPPA